MKTCTLKTYQWRTYVLMHQRRSSLHSFGSTSLMGNICIYLRSAGSDMHKINAAFFRCRRWFFDPDNHVIGHHRDAANTPRWPVLATHTLTPTTKCYLPFCASDSPRKLNVLAKHFRSHVRDYRSRGTRNKCSQALCTASRFHRQGTDTHTH